MPLVPTDHPDRLEHERGRAHQVLLGLPALGVGLMAVAGGVTALTVQGGTFACGGVFLLAIAGPLLLIGLGCVAWRGRVIVDMGAQTIDVRTRGLFGERRETHDLADFDRVLLRRTVLLGKQRQRAQFAVMLADDHMERTVLVDTRMDEDDGRHTAQTLAELTGLPVEVTGAREVPRGEASVE